MIYETYLHFVINSEIKHLKAEDHDVQFVRFVL